MALKASYRVTINNVPNVRKSLVGDDLMRLAKIGGAVVEKHAKLNANGRPGPNIDTGALVNSIIVQEAKKTRTYAEVAIGPTVEYGRIQELGGIITPVRAKLLSWVDKSGKRIFAKMVKIPARPYLRPALEENKTEIKNAISTAVRTIIASKIRRTP